LAYWAATHCSRCTTTAGAPEWAGVLSGVSFYTAYLLSLVGALTAVLGAAAGMLRVAGSQAARVIRKG
jgi:hypothetical protein